MNISRGEVSEFQYSSALTASKTNIIDVGTATNSYTIKVTDLKMTNATAVTVKFYQASTSNKGLEFDIPENSVTNLTWEMPYGISIVSSSGESRPFVGSASGTGVKYSISGYIEK